MHFNNQTLCVFSIGWIDCRDAFHAFICLSCCVISEYVAYWLTDSIKQVFQEIISFFLKRYALMDIQNKQTNQHNKN